MEARHTHPNLPKGTVDLIQNIYNNDLPFSKKLCLAEVMWEDKHMASVYVHRIEGIILADTCLNPIKDSYAVIVDGAALFAYNIGRFPQKQFFLFDRHHYETLTNKTDRFHYLAYTCLGGDGLPPDILVHVYDQHAKKMLEEIYLKELSL